jgi:uncharacterized protein YdaU (DUF1376 family)
MSTHPYIPLYVDDFEAATAHLTPEEDGIYNRLIRLAWRTPGCSLPNDPAWLARKIRVTEADFERVAKPILAEFFKVQRGRLVQKRLKAEYENISRKKSARVAAGKRGGDAKALKTKENAPSNASVLPTHTRAFPEPEPEPDKLTGDKSPASVAIEPPTDPDALTWHMAKILLADRAGMNSAQVGVFLGGVLSRNGITARDMLPAVSAATVNATLDPKGYLTKAAEGIARRQAPVARKVSGALV